MSKVTEYLDCMEGDVTAPDMFTREQADAWGSAYWAIRWDKSLTVEQMQVKIGEHSETFRPVREVHVNAQGNTVIHRHRSADRYLFDGDSDFHVAGWQCFDTSQDAWYYGVWVNPRTLKTLSYAEGDVYLVVCPDAAHYNAEIEAACEFHKEGFQMIACDMDAFQSLMLGGDPAGHAEVYRQDRSKFFAKV